MEITMRMRSFIANPDRNFVVIIKNGTIYKEHPSASYGAVLRHRSVGGLGWFHAIVIISGCGDLT